MSLWDGLGIVNDVLDVAMHPRFYVPLLCGVGIALALGRWMPPGDVRVALQVTSILTGLGVGLIWGWGK